MHFFVPSCLCGKFWLRPVPIYRGLSGLGSLTAAFLGFFAAAAGAWVIAAGLGHGAYDLFGRQGFPGRKVPRPSGFLECGKFVVFFFGVVLGIRSRKFHLAVIIFRSAARCFHYLQLVPLSAFGPGAVSGAWGNQHHTKSPTSGAGFPAKSASSQWGSRGRAFKSRRADHARGQRSNGSVSGFQLSLPPSTSAAVGAKALHPVKPLRGDLRIDAVP